MKGGRGEIHLGWIIPTPGITATLQIYFIVCLDTINICWKIVFFFSRVNLSWWCMHHGGVALGSKSCPGLILNWKLRYHRPSRLRDHTYCRHGHSEAWRSCVPRTSLDRRSVQKKTTVHVWQKTSSYAGTR